MEGRLPGWSCPAGTDAPSGTCRWGARWRSRLPHICRTDFGCTLVKRGLRSLADDEARLYQDWSHSQAVKVSSAEAEIFGFARAARLNAHDAAKAHRSGNKCRVRLIAERKRSRENLDCYSACE